MAWIEIGSDVISEVTADLAETALEEIREESKSRRGRPPTIEELLAAVEAALPGSEGGELSARFKGGADRTAAHAQPDSSAVRRLAGVFRDATDRYEDALDRKPRPSELLETLAFVLAPDLSEYVSDAEGLELEGLDYS